MKLCECGCGSPAPIATKTCTADGYVKGQPKRFISGHNKSRWSGGRPLSSEGYILVKQPDHPRANPHTGYVFEHIIVVERALGRDLVWPEEVHHVDEDRTNNDPCNLVLCPDRAYHMLLHARRRAIDACGHADWRPCVFCGRHDDPSEMAVRGKGHAHRGCRNSYHRNYHRDRRRAV